MHESNACKLARNYTVSTMVLNDMRSKWFSAEWSCFYANYVKVITFVHVKVNGSIKKMYLNFGIGNHMISSAIWNK